MTDPSSIPPGSPPPRLLGATRKLLRPLVRLLISYQVTYPQLIAMLKSLYVDVAESEFQVSGKRQSDSRINLLTGVHRKDVKRLRAEPRSGIDTPRSVSTGAQIIGHWLGNSDYLDADGNPRPLTVKAGASDKAEFDELVETVCKGDIRPRVILDEWLRLGVAELSQGSLRLNTGAFTPVEGFDEKVFFFGKNVQDHIAAGSHNLLGAKPAFFDRSVYYDRLSRQSLEELNALTAELGMRALTQVNRKALALQKQDSGRPGANYRMNFGIFNYNAELNGADESDDQA